VLLIIPARWPAQPLGGGLGGGQGAQAPHADLFCAT
jgi:hypothetical protein